MKKLLLLLMIFGCYSYDTNYKIIDNKINFFELDSINELKWKHRLLIILEKYPLNFFDQLQKYELEMQNRDLLIISMENNETFINSNQMSIAFTNSVVDLINNSNQNDKIYLIGKDGKIKKYYEIDIKISKIFSDIDLMPMRKRELKRQLSDKRTF